MADAGQIMERELSLCRRDLQPTGNQRVPIRWCPAIHFLEPIAVHVTCRKPPSRALQQRFRNWVCTAIILLHPCLNPERPETTRDSPERPRVNLSARRNCSREAMWQRESCGGVQADAVHTCVIHNPPECKSLSQLANHSWTESCSAQKHVR